MARHAAVSRRSAASAKVELCGRILLVRARSSVVLKPWNEVRGTGSAGVYDPDLHRTSTMHISNGFVGLDWRR
eukprot:4292595-Pleurochrysis_carterae.AAC.3